MDGQSAFFGAGRRADAVRSGIYSVAKFIVVADSNEAAAKAAQEKIGFARVTTDWHDVVTAPDVDLVDIATPNAFHYEVAKAALENGKNVYCEKPLSISAQESKELAALAAQKGVVNYVGFNNTMNPANAYVRELVQSGALGKIMRFTGTYDQDQLLDEKLPITWRHINKLAGCGALGDLGSHLLSISQSIMGDIVKVNAMSKVVFPKRPKAAGSSEMADVENEDIMTFMAEYANGAIGTIACSRVATGRKITSAMKSRAQRARCATILSVWVRCRSTSSPTTNVTVASVRTAQSADEGIRRPPARSRYFDRVQ